MKRFFVMGKQIMLAAVLFAGLSLTSCDKDDDEPEQPNNQQPVPTPDPDPDPTPTPTPDPDPDPTPTPDPDPTPAGKTVEIDVATSVINYNQTEFGYVLPEFETRKYTKVTIVLEPNENETIVRDNFGMVFKTNNNPHWESMDLPLKDRQLNIEYNETTKTVTITPQDGELGEGESFAAFRFYPANNATVNFTAKSIVAEYEGGEEPEVNPGEGDNKDPEVNPGEGDNTPEGDYNAITAKYTGQWSTVNFAVPEGAKAIAIELESAAEGIQFVVESDGKFQQWQSWLNNNEGGYGEGTVVVYREFKEAKAELDLTALVPDFEAEQAKVKEEDVKTSFTKITSVNIQCTVKTDYPTIKVVKAVVTKADDSTEYVYGVSCGWGLTIE